MTFLISVLFVIYISFVIVIEALLPSQCSLPNNYEIAKKVDSIGILSTFPIAIYTYICHPNVLDVYYVSENE